MKSVWKKPLLCAALGISTAFGMQAYAPQVFSNVAEAADYYVTSDEYGNRYWVVGNSIHHGDDWGQCEVKMTVHNAANTLLGSGRMQFGMNDKCQWMYSSSFNGGRWELVGPNYYILDIMNFVMSH